MKNFTSLLIIAILFPIWGCQLIEVPATATYSIEKALTNVGTSALPYYAYSEISLKKLNQKMKKAEIPVTIGETYELAYGKLFSTVPPDGDTGQFIDDIKKATTYFQRILAGNDVRSADHYFLTSIPDPEDGNFTLFAAVYRPYIYIKVPDKLNPSKKISLTPSDSKFYVPYKKIVDHEGLDTVYEWFALSTDCYDTQRHQAILLTLAANKVIEKKPSPEYWTAEHKWLAGDYMDVLIAQDRAVCRAVGVESGFTIR